MKTISFQEARKKILTVWLWMSVAVFVIFFIQTLLNRYTSHVKEVWQWLFQYLLPAITLMLGVLYAHRKTASRAKTDIFSYKIILGLSWFFLVLLLLSSFIVPLVHIRNNLQLPVGSQKNIMEAFKEYDYFLTAVQGLLMAYLGYFFAKQE